MLPTVEWEDRHFVRLSRASSTIIGFFTGKWAKLHPMKDSSTFDELVRLRNRASLGVLEDNAAEPDLDDLGVNAELEQPRLRRPRGALAHRLRAKRIVEISIDGFDLSVLS